MTEEKGALLVVGATSGVAQAFCDQSIDRGYSLVLACRDRKGGERIARDLRVRKNCAAIPVLACDAADFASHPGFVKTISEFVPLAGCFIACGVMHEQSDCENDWALCEETIACNYTGTVSLIHHLTPILLSGNEGFLSCLTSVAGDRGRQSNYLYGSTKAGLNVYLEGLRNRLFGRGLLVQTVKLGPTDTPMNTGVARAPFMIGAQQAAGAILSAIENRREVIYVPGKWRVVMAVIRALPRPVFNRLKL